MPRHLRRLLHRFLKAQHSAGPPVRADLKGAALPPPAQALASAYCSCYKSPLQTLTRHCSLPVIYRCGCSAGKAVCDCKYCQLQRDHAGLRMRVQLGNYIPAVVKMSLDLASLRQRSFRVRKEGLAFEICGGKKKARHTGSCGCTVA